MTCGRLKGEWPNDIGLDADWQPTALRGSWYVTLDASICVEDLPDSGVPLLAILDLSGSPILDISGGYLEGLS